VVAVGGDGDRGALGEQFIQRRSRLRA
jgi:hypothetical protein